MVWEFINGLVWFYINGSVWFQGKETEPGSFLCIESNNLHLSTQLVWSNYPIRRIQCSQKTLTNIKGVWKGKRNVEGSMKHLSIHHAYWVDLLLDLEGSIKIRRWSNHLFTNAYLIGFASRSFSIWSTHLPFALSSFSFPDKENQREKNRR